jgi:Cys-tRNA(Pro)/Cys-tRNA(Cys) deacylase
MMKPAEAERISGYKIGGVSPFGQNRRLRTAFDAEALAEPYVFVNGGQRGLQTRLSPQDVVRLLDAVVAPITA